MTKNNKQETTALNLRVTRETKQRLELLSKETGSTVSDVARALLSGKGGSGMEARIDAIGDALAALTEAVTNMAASEHNRGSSENMEGAILERLERIEETQDSMASVLVKYTEAYSALAGRLNSAPAGQQNTATAQPTTSAARVHWVTFAENHREQIEGETKTERAKRLLPEYIRKYGLTEADGPVFKFAKDNGLI